MSVLLRILDNIINEPHNNKYRTIRLENNTIKEKLLPLRGIRELLNAIGFIEVNAVYFYHFLNFYAFCRDNRHLGHFFLIRLMEA